MSTGNECLLPEEVIVELRVEFRGGSTATVE